MSFNLKVPPNWKQPQGEELEHFNQAFKPEEKSSSPGMPPLFQPASLNKYHTDAQKMHIAKIGGFIDKICSAICSAWDAWHKAATLVGVIINGPIAAGGKVVGPPWTPVILASGPMSSPMEMKYTQVIADVLGRAWLTYTTSITVPGLPFYPVFATVPSPVAPPSPNVPVPVKMLGQVDVSLQPAMLKNQMVLGLGDPTAPFHAELFECICVAFNQMFQVWTAATQVTNVIGTGATTFAPPAVPVGTVVGGTGNMTPGGFV